MVFYGFLMSAILLVWGALGFAGLGTRVTTLLQIGAAFIVVLAAGSFVIAEAMGN